MKSLPLPLRVAAGLAVTVVEQARTLPTKIVGLPVTVASQALQASMRVQQQVTELAIRGDEVLAGLRPVEETPEWATFDEDVDDDRYDLSRPPAFDSAFDRVDADLEQRNGHHPTVADSYATPTDADFGAATDPWVLEERALAEETDAQRETDDARPLPESANYDELSLPQLRARLRRYSADELTELLEYERAHGNRPSFVGMLTRRIATVRDQQ